MQRAHSSLLHSCHLVCSIPQKSKRCNEGLCSFNHSPPQLRSRSCCMFFCFFYCRKKHSCHAATHRYVPRFHLEAHKAYSHYGRITAFARASSVIVYVMCCDGSGCLPNVRMCSENSDLFRLLPKLH